MMTKFPHHLRGRPVCCLRLSHEMVPQFVKAAITTATGPAPADPCPTGLYLWQTAQASGPGGKAVFYQTRDGNDFYTLPADLFGKHKR